MSGTNPSKYTVGDLEVRISAISTDALASIDALITKMSSLSSVLKSITTADLKWITSFGTRMRTLSKNMASVDWHSLETGFSRLAVAITPFLDKVSSAQVSLQALSYTIDKLNTKKFSNLLNAGAGVGVGVGATAVARSSRRGGFFSFSKLIGTIYIARRLANVLVDIVQYGSDFTETLNLWQVAMRDNVSMATEFVNKMSKAYGISQKTVMQAQATFRNMIGSLGDLNDATSYALSEAITQMAIDYSSLYNTPIEEAINKFQSALAGQVRPIRSISGYDITEKTIQALYEALDGTKTQRQLSRTEKQLLAIYAVFNQMEKSGALGDMTKTLDNFANQSRMMVENWKEFATWLGTVLKYLLQESGVMLKINAALITGANVMKALAFSLGYETEDFAAGWENNVDNTIKAVDELQGKLLGFDKIRAMETTEDDISIDEKLLQAISGYSTLIDQANNKAQKLAEQWTTWWVDEDGELTEQANNLIDALKALGLVLAGLTVSKFAQSLNSLKGSFDLLSGAILTGALYAFIKMVDYFEKGEYWSGILAGVIGVSLVSALILLRVAQNKAAFATVLHNTAIQQQNPLMEAAALKTAKLAKGYGLLAVGIAAAAAGFALLWSNDDMGWGQKIISTFVAIAAAIGAAAIAINVFKMNWAGAIGVAGLVAGGAATIASSVGSATAKKFANGGTPDKGTLFIAGEAGAEIVATSPNGQTGVSNVQQIEQAFYNALVRYGGGDSGGEFVIVKIGEDEVFRATRNSANRRGLDFAKKG